MRELQSAWMVGLLMCAACTEIERPEIGGGGEGDPCGQVSDCQAGFDCVDGVCAALEPLHTGPARGDCCDAALFALAFPDGACDEPLGSCGDELVCGTQGVCTLSEGQPLGGPCGLQEDCIPPLVCHGNRAVCVDPALPNDVDGDGQVDVEKDGTCPGGENPCALNTPALPDGTCLGGEDPVCPATLGGVRDLGEPCDNLTDCRRPYVCAMGQILPTCEKVPYFAGPDCSRSDDEQGLFRVYHELPPGSPTEPPFEFYRLPFPNDIRFVKDGRIDLSGHPSPGDVLGIDVAGTIFAAIEEDVDGFAINSPVYFRLTDPPAYESLCLDSGSHFLHPAPVGTYCEPSGPATVFLVNIDPDSPGYGERVPVQLTFTETRGQYACQNLLALGPLDGQPLRHGTTYAAVITTGLRDRLGDAPIPDRDFVHVLDGAAIAAGKSPLPAHVIEATQPLRDWLEDEPTYEPADIAAATVFTTGEPDAVASALRQAVHDESEPTFKDGAFACAPGAPGVNEFNCHGTPDRACPATPNPLFTEIHGTYVAPAFQQGLRPYLTPDQGGAMDPRTPTKQSNEEMCFALVVPNTPPPAEGYPVIMVGHGTGGSYRSFVHMPNAYAGDTMNLTELWVSMGFAVIGFDNVMHGPRQGPVIGDIDLATPASWVDPDNLFFNVINARAARDNVLQGAADLFWLTRLVRTEGLRAPGERTLTVTGVDIAFDPEQIFYFGHSQGTTIAFPFLQEEVHLRAAILSGAGAELPLSILNKREPINIASAAGAAFADANLTRLHPMMGMLSQLFGPADAIAYAEGTLFGSPEAIALGRQPTPLLVFSGALAHVTEGVNGDNYTPDTTQYALFSSMNLPLLAEGATVSNNLTSPDGTRDVTAGVVRLDPDGAYDGHFVGFSHADSEDPVTSFLDSARIDPATTEIAR